MRPGSQSPAELAALPNCRGKRGVVWSHLSSRVKLALMDAIDHRTAITNLEPALRQSLIERRDGPGLLRFSLHLGGILALGTLIALRVPFWFLLLPVQGVLIVFLFTALHECIHETAFKSSFLNTAVSSLSGFLILIPPTWFRFFHFAHHRHTHDPARDPELQTPKPSTVIGYVKHVSGLPLWFSAIRTLLRNATGRSADDYVPEKANARVTVEARVMLALYVLIAVLSVLWESPLPSGHGSSLPCSVNRSCGSFFWPSIPTARMSTTCSKTRARLSRRSWCGWWHGTCPFTRSIMPCRRCHSTSCRTCMKRCASI